MKYRYVVLLGRPGCGKSSLYRELEERILASGQAQTFQRIDDFPKVWAKCQRDDALERDGKARIYTRRDEKGHYVPTNDSFLDDVLKEVNADVLEIDRPNHLIFIEFARPRCVDAIQIFDRRILDRCLAIYMQVSFDISWERNVARHQAQARRDGDDHFVCRETMEKVYVHDDRDAFVRYLRDRDIPVFVVNNECDGEEHFKSLANELFESLF